MKIRMEHANLAVRDVEGMIRFLQTAFPDFRIRWEGRTLQGWRWVHVGNAETYIAVTEAPKAPAEDRAPYSGRPGLNHLGFEVDDADALRRRLAAAGYCDSTFPNAHPHRTRVYFHDDEGNDWEFVEYFSDDPAERNDYEIPDPA
jgi:catechol 2,3-dioxygenase-like lactoylglutathione lyase family enzyme